MNKLWEKKIIRGKVAEMLHGIIAHCPCYRQRLTLYAGAAVMLLSACADSEYSNYPCHLVINNSTMQNMTLGSAMNAMSPGVFCRISRDGKTRFKFETNQNSEPSYGMLTAIDQKAQWTIGIYNAIIVGFGNQTGKFYAYDSQCRNCYESSGLTRYALTMNTDGTATCRYCHRVYDMNSGGILIKGDKGRGMIEYRGNTTGTFGILTVNN